MSLVELQILGFLSIGPQVSVTAEVGLSFTAEANVLIGAALDMNPSSANVDFLDENHSCMDSNSC